jgi:hypothetical protein
MYAFNVIILLRDKLYTLILGAFTSRVSLIL